MNQRMIKQEEETMCLFQEWSFLPEHQEEKEGERAYGNEDLVMWMESPFDSNSLQLTHLLDQMYNYQPHPCAWMDDYLFQSRSLVDTTGYIKPEHISLPLIPSEPDAPLDQGKKEQEVKKKTREKEVGKKTKGPKKSKEEKKAKKIKQESCCKKKKITAYDSQTTTYLQSVFFEVYSKQPKLTKQQRIEVQKKTGLPSRNITYWFSNHKRRFQGSLNLFKQVTENGSVATYNDFIKWRRKHGLPEQVTKDELKKH